MKKYLSILTCLVLVLQFTTVSWAGTIDNTETVTPMRIVIPLSEDEEDVAIMQKSGLEKFGLEKNESTYALGDKSSTFDLSGTNDLTLNFTKKIPIKNGLIVSGTAEISVGGETICRQFADATLKFMDLGNNKAVYEGVVDISTVENDIEIPAYIDIVAKTDFSEIVANVSLGTLESDAGLLAFGSYFEEYLEYYSSMGKVEMTDVEYNELAGTSEMRAVNSSADGYVFGAMARNSTIDGTTATGETVIIVAARRDFYMRDDSFGFEIGRIFSRSTNARNAVDGATRAYPYSTTIEFECLENGFLSVNETYPLSSTSTGLANVISLATSLTNFSAGSFLEIAVGAIMEALSDVQDDIDATTGSSTHNWEKVTMMIDPNNYESVDLPSNQSYTNAKTNQTNGMLAKFEYRTHDADFTPTANVEVSGRIVYKIYAGTHRIYTVSSGTAIANHLIYNRNYDSMID